MVESKVSGGLARANPRTDHASGTAQRLLEGARRLLERSGYASLTLDAVAREAGETKSLIRYHFGSKQGLLVALVDWLLHEYTSDQQRVAEILDGEDRVHQLSQSLIPMMLDTASNRLFFDLMSHATKDPSMRSRAAGLFALWRQITVSALMSSQAEGVPKKVMTLASMTVAVADGLALQVLADPESVDVRQAMEVWETCLATVLSEDREYSVGAGSAGLA